MLRVDLGQLHKKGRIRIDGVVSRDSTLWESADLNLVDGLEVGFDVQHAARDIIVRGRIRGRTEDSCRRCLRPVESAIDEEITYLFRPGLDEDGTEGQDVFGFDDKLPELDLGPAVREQVILAVPRFPLCDTSCRGLCAKCGTDLNERSCECREDELDPRWSALRELTK